MAARSPADNNTLKSSDFLAMTSLKDKDGNDVEYFGGQKFNEVLAEAAHNVITGYSFLPYEVYVRAYLPIPWERRSPGRPRSPTACRPGRTSLWNMAISKATRLTNSSRQVTAAPLWERQSLQGSAV